VDRSVASPKSAATGKIVYDVFPTLARTAEGAGEAASDRGAARPGRRRPDGAAVAHGASARNACRSSALLCVGPPPALRTL